MHVRTYAREWVSLCLSLTVALSNPIYTIGIRVKLSIDAENDMSNDAVNAMIGGSKLRRWTEEVYRGKELTR